MIRNARYEDLNTAVKMMKAFYEEICLEKYGLKFKKVDAEKSLKMFIDFDNGILLVSDNNGKLTGILGALSSPWFADTTQWIFSALFFWIAPDSRKTGLARKFIEAFESKATDSGSIYVSFYGGSFNKIDDISDREIKLSKMFQAFGYNYIESLFIKEVI